MDRPKKLTVRFPTMQERDELAADLGCPDPGTVGEYATTLDEQGEDQARALFPDVHDHVQTCPSCNLEAREVSNLIRRVDQSQKKE